MASTYLLTGATGLIGGAWLDRLLEEEPDASVLAVARRPSAVRNDPRVTVIPADLSRETPEVERWFPRITAILHTAADIRFGLPLDKARAINVAGTERMLAIARKCPRLDRFVHVSTVFVAGGRPGELREEPLTEAPLFFNSYQQTKWEAEQAVIAASDVPWQIVRLSTIVSDSQGRVAQRNYFHQLLGLIPRNPLPCIAAAPGVRVDLIPSDWTVKQLDAYARRDFRAHGIRHVCAGAAGSAAFSELFDRAYELYGKAALKPRLVPAEEFRAAAGGLQNGARELIRVLGYFLPHLCVQQSFATSAPSAAPAILGYYDEVVRSVLGA